MNSASDECGWRDLPRRAGVRVHCDNPNYYAEADVMEKMLAVANLDGFLASMIRNDPKIREEYKRDLLFNQTRGTGWLWPSGSRS